MDIKNEPPMPVVLRLRIDRDLKEAADNHARAMSMTTSDLVRMLLREKIGSTAG